MSVTLSGIMISLSDEQFLKTSVSNILIPDGILTDSRLEQDRKANLEIVVTVSGITILLSLVQESKAPSQISWSSSGSFMLSKAQPLKP